MTLGSASPSRERETLETIRIVEADVHENAAELAEYADAPWDVGHSMSASSTASSE